MAVGVVCGGSPTGRGDAAGKRIRRREEQVPWVPSYSQPYVQTGFFTSRGPDPHVANPPAFTCSLQFLYRRVQLSNLLNLQSFVDCSKASFPCKGNILLKQMNNCQEFIFFIKPHKLATEKLWGKTS